MAMRPLFRNDLICSREEQQGVVFYRVDDPRTETNFRLYEIEYLIAQKLDGSRELADVIEAVKSEYSFDISEPDLQRFVSQLDSMGFLVTSVKDGVQGDAVAPDEETQIMPREQVPRGPEPDLMMPTPSEVDRSELERLLRSALLHVKQGYTVHARDYFLAAKELDPSDERLAQITGHLEIMGDMIGPAEIEYLWQQSQRLFPELTAELGPLAGPPPAEEAHEAPASQPRRDALNPPEAEEDLRTRVLWTMLLLVVLVGGIGLFVWVIHVAGLFPSEAPVKVATLEATRIPVFHAKPAAKVGPLREQWLSFAERGTVAEIMVSPNQRVNAGDVIASLDLLPPQKRQLMQARAAVNKAQEQHGRIAKRLGTLVAQREAIQTEVDTATDKLKELQPKQLLGQGGVSKRDIEKWKRIKAQAGRKLAQAAKKERGPAKQEAIAKKKLAAAQKRLEAVERQLAGRLLRAAFAGVVVQADLQKGQPVAGKKGILLRDESAALLSFELPAGANVQPGGQAFVAVERGSPANAKIADVKKTDGGVLVEVTLADPSGTFGKMAPKSFRLVREFVDPAFRIPSSALVQHEGGKMHVFIVAQGRALARDIEVLERDDASAVVRDASGSLRNGEQLVVAHLGEGQVQTIADGALLQVKGQ